MKFSKIIFLSLLFFLKTNTFSQLLLNGDFLLGSSLWGCTPEVSIQSSYGGLGSNLVAEVDAGATLCQTVIGFVPGSTYYISVDATRRTGGCGSPATTNVNLTVAGCLSVTITRTNTVFGWTPSAYIFTATSLIHTITFSAGAGFGGSTCGMIIDNVVVAASALPIELTDFSSEIKNKQAVLLWSTATEKNNNYFNLEKSTDGINFSTAAQITSKAKNGNSTTPLHYEAADQHSGKDILYYRLKQVDYDGSFSYSKIISLSPPEQTEAIRVFPNPGHGKFNLDLSSYGKNREVLIEIYDPLGRLNYRSEFKTTESAVYEINPEQPLEPGYYQFRTTVNGIKTNIKVLVQ